MRKYVITGVQGSGKGTQAKMLAEDLDLVHISVGDIFRWNVQNHTKMGAQVRRIMASGELVGDDLAESVVRDRLTQHDWNYGFIIDGFPRNRRQAEFFLESYDINGVIVLDLPDSEVRRRVLNRRLCGNCGMDYNLIANSPAVPGQCDMCGGELVTREDDTEEALAVRLREYHQCWLAARRSGRCRAGTRTVARRRWRSRAAGSAAGGRLTAAVAARLTVQFAACLAGQISGPAPAAAPNGSRQAEAPAPAEEHLATPQAPAPRSSTCCSAAGRTS